MASLRYEQAVCEHRAEQLLKASDSGASTARSGICSVAYAGVLGYQWPWYSSQGWLLHTPGLRHDLKVEVLREAAAE